MGCISSQLDIGFDWWKLLRRQKWKDIEQLVQLQPDTCLQPKPGTEDLLLHCLCSDLAAPLPLILMVIAAHKAVAMMKNSAGKLPLHISCSRPGRSSVTTELVRTLVATAPQACKVGMGITEKDGTSIGELPLHVLLSNGGSGIDIDMCGGMLLESYPDAAKEKRNGSFPLELGLCAGAPDHFMILMVDIFPSAAKSSSVSQYGTMVNWACRMSKSVELTLKLIRIYPEGCAKKDANGNLPLHICCESSSQTSSQVILELIRLHPAGLQQQDKDGNLPIHSAVERGDIITVGVIEKMLELNPAAMRIKDKQGNTPLHSAAECLKINLVAVLTAMLAAGPSAAEVKDRDGNLPLHCVCESKKLT